MEFEGILENPTHAKVWEALKRILPEIDELRAWGRGDHEQADLTVELPKSGSYTYKLNIGKVKFFIDTTREGWPVDLEHFCIVLSRKLEEETGIPVLFRSPRYYRDFEQSGQVELFWRV